MFGLADFATRGATVEEEPIGPMLGPKPFKEQPRAVRARGRAGKALKKYGKKARAAILRAAHSADRFDAAQAGTYGPVRYGSQPSYVYKRTRAGKKRKSSSWGRSARSSGTSKRARRAANRAAYRAGSGRKSNRARNRQDYAKFLNERSKTYGPVRFETQPTWVRRRGRKGQFADIIARRGRKGSSKRSRKSSGMTRRERRAANRAAFRASNQRSRKGGRKGSRRGRKGSRAMTSGRGPSRVLSYNSLMHELRQSRGLKAWVCVGKKRTGCGGGKKGRRGSRQLGLLRA